MPYLGGLRITALEWVGTHSLLCSFTSTWGSAYQYQLYAGRTLAGVTPAPEARTVQGVVRPSLWPQHIRIVAVTSANRLTDYGYDLPPRPYNRVELSYTLGASADAKYVDITGGTVPGGAVDSDNLLDRRPYKAGAQSLRTKPLEGTGTWNFEVASRDDKPPLGNLSDPLEIAAAIRAHPPDVVQDVSGNRLSAEVAGGVLSVSFTEP